MRGTALFLLGAVAAGLPALWLSQRLWAVARTRRRRERALRAALLARIWRDGLQQVSPIASDSPQLARLRHEANNALSTALLSAQFLSALSGAEEVERAHARAEQKLAAGELVEALLRLKGMIAQAGASQTTTSPRSPLVSPTPLFEAVTECVARAQRLHPQLAIEVVRARPALERARVLVCAGAEGLSCVLDALLENACEGDGARAAGRVTLSAGAERELDVVSLEIEDDGPGFSAAQLAEPPRPFASTKPERLGLGLYTAEHVLSASGGSLRRENAPGGGARLTAFLPAAPSEPDGAAPDDSRATGAQ